MPARIASSSRQTRRGKPQPSRNVRSRRARFSKRYHDSSTDTGDETSDDDAFSDGSEAYSDAPRPKRIRLSATRSTSTKGTANQGHNTRAPGFKTNVAVIVEKACKPTARQSGKSIPWQTLPYELLLKIFQYASYPLCNEQFEANTSTQWLLQLSLLCRSFAEPALSALYYAPPLLPPSRASGLLVHLRSQSPSSTINYKAKIKYLDLEVISVLGRKYNGSAPLDLAELVKVTPQLHGIGLHLIADRPQYQRSMPVTTRFGRIYRSSLLMALESDDIRLQSFKWNFSFNRGEWPWCSLAEIHSTAPFQTLRTLDLVRLNNFSQFAKNSEQADDLVKALNLLPNLKSLNFTLCNFVPKLDILDRLPRSMESLEFSDCGNIDANALAKHLHTHGGNLRNLSLNHNRYLNLAFLADLAITCPKLELFRMDLTFFSFLVTALDSEPNFGTLLPSSVIPTWPSTLHSIELNHLRKWQTEGAEVFFQSLVDSAQNLPSLRKLSIKASLETDWRSRLKFRDTWVEQMERVFKRRSRDTEHYAQPVLSNMDGKIMGRIRKPSTNNNQTTPKASVEENSSDSDIPILSSRRSCRLTKLRLEETSRADSTHSTAVRQQAQSKNGTSQDIYIQGLCEVVDVRIDNLRPMEMQYQEKDFMDDEPSGDEDWNGEDLDLPGTAGHAW